MKVVEKLKTRDIQTKILKYFILFGYLPLGILLGLFTPDDVLARPWARSYTEFMASWLPFVAEVGRWTSVPATQFIAAVMNVVAIFYSLMLVCNTKLYLQENMLWAKTLPVKKKIFILVFGIPFCICVAYLVLFLAPINHPPGRRDRIMINSNLGMGIYGSLIIAGGWLAIAITIIIAVLFFVMVKRYLLQRRNSV